MGLGILDAFLPPGFYGPRDGVRSGGFSALFGIVDEIFTLGRVGGGWDTRFS
jgi:hypothetical protein